MREIILRPIPEEDGSYLEEPEYEVLLDGEHVTTCRTDGMEIRDGAFDPLWERLDLRVIVDDDVLMG